MQFIENDLLGVCKIFVIGLVCIFVEGAIYPLTKTELIQMGIRPAHGDLNDVMEVEQSYVGRDLNPPPDFGIGVKEGDFELIGMHFNERFTKPNLFIPMQFIKTIV
jgi:hypothetical protein